MEYSISGKGEITENRSIVSISYVEKLKRKVYAVHLIGDWAFIDYPEGIPTTTAAYNTASKAGLLSDSFNPDQKSLLTVVHPFSRTEQEQPCSIWFRIDQPPRFSSSGTVESDGMDSMESLCIGPDGRFQDAHNRWSDLRDLLWDGGQVNGNVQDRLVVQHDSRSVTIGAPGIPAIPLAPTPPQWKSGVLGAADVAGADEQYLVLRDRTGPDRTTLMIWKRGSRQWSSIARPAGRFAYRIFGPWMTANALSCEPSPDPDEVDEICVPSAESLIDLRTGRTLPIDAGKDSEIILLAPDGKGLLREGETLYSFTAGAPAATRTKIAQNPIMTHVHWAWYR